MGSQVLEMRAFQDGCGPTQDCQSQLGNGFQGTKVGCLLSLLVFFSVFTLRQTFHLLCFCSLSQYQPGSHFPFFFLTSSLGHVPFPFISAPFFPHVKTPAFLHSAPPPSNTNSCYAVALIIPQTRRAEECRLHLAP